MEIKIKYNQIAQYFFYLSNLSNWHFSCVPEYNKFWLKKTGKLTSKEKDALKELKKILKKYEFDKETTNYYLGKPFIDSPENKIWENVRGWVDKEEFQEFKKIFNLFEKKLNILWQEDQKRLPKIAKALNKQIKSPDIKRALKALEILLNQKVNNFTIHLFTIPQKSSTSAGGANTNNKVITLELKNKKDAKEAIFITLHEIAHYLIRNSEIKFNQNLVKSKEEKLLRIPLFQEQGIDSAWQEAVLISLLPDGFIKQLATGQSEKIKKRLNLKKRSDFENYLIHQTQEEIRKYFRKKKPIDQKFANFVLEKSLEFTKNAK